MEDTGISSIDIDALMSETKPAVCSAKRSVFVFTYKSDADLSPELLQTMTAKTHDSCCVDNVRHSLINTWNPRRISAMEKAIHAWNDKNDAKIFFEPIESFTKTPEDHPTVLTIREWQKRGEGLSWTCDRLVRKLEIDMVPQGDIGEKRKRTVNQGFKMDSPTPKSQKLNKRDMEAAKFLAKHSLGVDNNSLERVISALEAALDAKNETIAVMAMRFAQPVI